MKPFENFFSVRDCDGCIRRGLGAWQIAARYSHADLTDEDIIGGVGQSFTLAVNREILVVHFMLIFWMIA